jgi:hypothetical protein
MYYNTNGWCLLYFSGAEERGWWFSRGDNYYNALNYTDCTKGYNESLECIKQAFIEQVGEIIV